MDALGAIWSWFTDASLMDWTIRGVFYGFVPQAIFVIGFGMRNTWWTSLLGWGQFVKAFAVAIILGANIAEVLWHWVPDGWVSFVIVLLIDIGATLQCLAWVAEKRHVRLGGEPRENNPDLYA
jgi:hypothetical protein